MRTPIEKAMMNAKPVVHLLSGGLDSTVLLYDLIQQGCQVFCVIFDYGQQHDNEIECAQRTCLARGVHYRVVSLRDVFRDSSLVKGGTGSIVVPNRNGTFLSIGAAIAISAKAEAVTIACNADDRELFPDCRPEFIKAMNRASQVSGALAEICAPYVDKTKREIVTIGRRLKVNFNATWSCYKGGRRPCGKCHACVVRNSALE